MLDRGRCAVIGWQRLLRRLLKRRVGCKIYLFYIMIRYFFFAALAAVTVATAKPQKAPQTLPGGWVYAWGDEFNGRKLDESKWKHELGVVRNQGSKQAYTKDCVKLRRGMLVLESRSKETPNATYKEGGKKWFQKIKTQPFASGSVTSLGKQSFTPPCRLEFRAKIPKAKGVWPAIWTLHQNKYGWPANGEIDILEHVSQESSRVYSIFRWGKNGTNEEYKVIKTTDIPDLSKDFHTYALEWTEEYMLIEIDGQEVGRVAISDAEYPNGDNPLLTPCYLILNTALGGWAVEPDAKDYPVEFLIDYVRCYTKPEHLDYYKEKKTQKADEDAEDEPASKPAKRRRKSRS